MKSFTTSTAGMIDADSARRSPHSLLLIANVWNTGRSPGTSTATRWMPALSVTAATSGLAMNGTCEKSERVFERQLNAWSSGLRASRENAMARACLIAKGSFGRSGAR